MEGFVTSLDPCSSTPPPLLGRLSSQLTEISFTATPGHCLLSHLCANPRRIWIPLLCPLLIGSCRNQRDPPFPFSRLIRLSSASPCTSRSPALTILVASARFIPVPQCLPCTGEPQNGHSIQMWSHKSTIKGEKESLPLTRLLQLCCNKPGHGGPPLLLKSWPAARLVEH